jgi:hypothetical protein
MEFMSKQMKLILSYVLFAISAIGTFFGFSTASQPSVMPIATVLGAFAIPALFFWWGLILYRSAKKMDADK